MQMVRKALVGAALLSTLGLASAIPTSALAQETCYVDCGNTPQSTPTTLVDPKTQTQSTQTQTTSTSSSLPFTGADMAATAVVGVVLLGSGATVLTVARRRRPHGD